MDVAGSTYTWASSILGPINPLSVTASGSGPIVDNPVNVGNGFGTVTYTITPIGPGGTTCVGASVNYVVTVNREPVGVNDIKTVCSDDPINYSLLLNVAFLGNGAGSTFSWLATDNPNPLVTGETTVATIGPSITDAITNRTSTNQNVVYTVTPTGTNGCLGAPFLITITIKPEPVGVSTTAPAICSGSNVNYDLQNNVNTGPGNGIASNFTWTAVPNPDVSGETTALKSGSMIDDVLINTSAVNRTVTYIVTPTSQTGSCQGDPFTILVDVNPKAIFLAGPNLIVCSNENDILIQGSVTFSPAAFVWSGGTFDDNTLEQPHYILSAADKAIVIPTTRVLTINIPASGVCAAESQSMNLTIYPLPNANFLGIPGSGQHPENGPILELNAFQSGGLFTILPGSGLSGTSINPSTNFDFSNLAPNLATIYDGTPASINKITYSFTDVNGCTNSNTQNLIINSLTVVDFAVQGASTDIDGDFRVCANSGDILLIPLDGGNPGQAPETAFLSLTPGLILNQSGAQYYIPTNTLPSGTYEIQFTYKNIAGVVSNRLRNVKVQASPVVSFTSLGSCFNSPTVFTSSTSIDLSNFPTTISNLQWNFGDFTGLSGPPLGAVPPGTNSNRTSGTYDAPQQIYGNSNSFTVSLTATTAQGCATTYVNPTSIVVGTIPVVDFDYFAICNNDSTRFTSIVTNLGGSTVAKYNWDFNDGDTLSGVNAVPPGKHAGRTIGTYEEPLHRYNAVGQYNPSLAVITDLGCLSLPKSRPVTITPYVTVVASGSNPPEGFENGRAGWFIEDLVTPDDSTFVSWNHGSPTGSTINTSINGSKVWWTSKNSATYFPSEKSAVNSPCFNLDTLKRPMISLDYFSDIENNLDGVVMQYSIDGGKLWQLVGPLAGAINRDEGINWFNGQSIPSSPGNQLIGQYGWTGKQGSWKNARFNLDMVDKLERDQVRLRLAFASNQTNDPNLTFDGFAFDNVYVGEKQRTVLVEHFTTSTLVPSIGADNYLNGLYQAQLADRGTSDFEDIQYHVNFFGTDQFNKENPTDPAARALYFGASQPPYTIMDGILVPGKFTGVTSELNKIELDRRALVDPPFRLTLKDTTSVDNTHISVKMVIEAKQDFTSPLIMNVALVEKDISISGVNFKRVLRKNLFNSDGETINLAWIKGQKVIKLKFDVLIDVPISTDPNGMMLIGYVQDKNTKEIYQAIAIDAPAKIGAPVTGIDDDSPALAALTSIQMFPNPANQEFSFGLPADVHPSSQWRIIDQRGVTVLEGDFSDAVNGLKTVQVSGLSNAVYFVVMTGPQGAIVRKKLIVLNRN